MSSCDRQSGSSGTDQPWSRPSSTARVIAAVPNRARTWSTAASSALSRRALEREHQLHRGLVVQVGDRHADQRQATVTDHGAGECQQLAGGRQIELRLGGRKRQRVRPRRPREIVEAKAQDDGAPDPAGESHPPGDPVDQRDQNRRRSPPSTGARGRVPAASRSNASAAWSAPAGDRDCGREHADACPRPVRAATPAPPRPAGRPGPQSRSPARAASSRSPAPLPTAAPPAAGAGTRALRRAAPPAGRRAWPPRSPPWPETWCVRCRR